MRTSIALASLASLAGLAAAQTGYGRFPCTIVNGDGTFSADQSQCADANLVAPGTGDGVENADPQGDLPNPTNAQCVQQLETGAYFCGIAGATCTSDANCDNGHCVDGTCQGGFEQNCASDDANCLGYLYCLTADFGTTSSNTCGGLGAFCQDAVVGNSALSDDANYAAFNQYCSSGYCNYATAACDVHVALGGDCSVDPEYGCAEGLQCNRQSYTCEVAAVPSAARARARRSAHLGRRNLCPASHSSCNLPSGGFECIDVQANLEQCGACAEQGGVDCTAIEGSESVGCVAGRCEIWSCQDGYAYDAAAETCVKA
ncbi:hypothetical protein JCM10213_002758 [Rhodosporidiobolus nylandii]